MKQLLKFECPYCNFIEWIEQSMWTGRGFKRCVMCRKLTLPYQIFDVEEDEDVSD